MDQLSDRARQSARLRTNHNFHEDLDDGIQRMLNAMEPGTYVRPHCHASDRWEYFQIIRGRVRILLFDPAGQVLEITELNASDILAIEIPGGTIHSIVSLESGTVLFELKPGPYQATTDKNFAHWAPAENSVAKGRFLAWFEHAEIGESPPVS